MKIKQEFEIFLTAVMFYTRIPVPKGLPYSQKYLDESTRYFPFIGWIVGGFAAIVFYISQLMNLPTSVGILCSMIATVLLTGAFHEDAFGDVCDGFGGAATKEKILEIMKDSRIGNFGAIGIVLILLSKFILLVHIHPLYIPIILLSGHALSRFAVSIFRYTHKYVKENEESKAKPMAKNISIKNLIIAAAGGVYPATFLGWHSLALIFAVILTEQLMAKYFYKRIGGYTGDCLGATQQICEISFYFSFSLLWKFI